MLIPSCLIVLRFSNRVPVLDTIKYDFCGLSIASLKTSFLWSSGNSLRSLIITKSADSSRASKGLYVPKRRLYISAAIVVLPSPALPVKITFIFSVNNCWYIKFDMGCSTRIVGKYLFSIWDSAVAFSLPAEVLESVLRYDTNGF